MFFEVSAKCGHVGRGRYIVKQFYISTFSAKEAARIIRLVPRVKHHKKDAILNVTRITYEEYVEGVIKNAEDAYFHIHNSSAQRQLMAEDICEEYEEQPQRVRNVEFKLKKHRMLENISKKLIAGVI